MKKKLKIILPIFIIIAIIFAFTNIKNYRLTMLLNNDYIPKYYINNLYKSKEINYRLLLDEREKELYEEIIENIIDFKTNFSITLTNPKHENSYLNLDDINEIIKVIQMDHPELIQLGGISISTTKGSNKIDFNCIYVMNKDDYEKSVQKIKRIITEIEIATFNMDEYSKVKYVYDYIGEKNRYGDVNDWNGQSAYSAFSENLSPVCSGYAKASQIIFNNIGINSVLVFGDARYALFVGDNHAWNHVEIDGKYYLYDVTMSNSGKDHKDEKFYDGFLLKDTSKHSPWYKKATPYLNGKKYINKN